MSRELEEQIAAVGPGDHLCLVYEEPAEQLAAIAPFIRMGLERGEQCLYIVDDRTAGEVSAALEAAGIDVAAAGESGALILATKRETYLREGHFDPAGMLEFLRGSLAGTLEQGYSALRITGEMTWALGPEVGCDRLMEYETGLNAFFPGSRALAICQYNRRRFPPQVIRDVLRTHPVAILGEQVCPNLYYEPPEFALDQSAHAERVEWMIGQLRRARESEQHRATASAEREHLTGELQYQLTLTRTITENAASCLCTMDARGHPTFVNPAFERVTGYVLEEIRDRPLHDAVHYKYPDGSPYPMEECPIDRAYPVMEPVPYGEEVFVRKDGSLFPVAFAVAPLEREGENVGAVLEFRDITEQREAERALRAEQERTARLQAVTASLSRALTPADVADVVIREGYPALGAAGGLVVVLDEEGRQFTLVGAGGYTAEALEPWRQSSVDRPAPIAEAVRRGEPVFLETAEEAAARYPDLPLLTDASVIGAVAALPLLVDDRPVGGMSVRFAGSRSFSAADRAFMRALADQCAQALERARLYEAEQRARREAEAATRLRNDFLSVAAHELKTPATSLRGYAQVALRRLEREGALDPERVRVAFRAIDQQTAKLSRLVEQLLDVSRIDAHRLVLEREPTDLAALVRAASEAAQMRTDRHRIAVSVPDEPVTASVDALRIEQVLVNLLDNAIKYSPSGGDVDVALRADDRSASTEPQRSSVVDRRSSGEAAGGWVEIAVRDRGMGVAPELRDRIFDRFFQAHTQHYYSGMGLGLFISRQIVELHGGTITPEFPEDGGTRFVVRLPVDA